jgi:hypothetical protein
MDLTPERKAEIDTKSYRELLEDWRYAPVGYSWFQGETGQYWTKRMAELRAQDPAAAAQASKDIGWG